MEPQINIYITSNKKVINLKSKKKQNLVRVLFLLVLFFVGNYYLANPINNKVNREINNYTLTNVEILGTSGHWNLAPFVIDDSGGGDYTWEEASAETWCSGSGTLEEPYLIENVTIDGGNLANCITIKNSDKYFRIENCTVFNSGAGAYEAGIHLDLAGNGTLINNNCSFNNKNGMYLYGSDNTTVSENIANNNQDLGIYVRGSDNTTISENTANNNQNLGIYVCGSDNNTISENTANNNSYCGIYIYHSDNNTVSGNTANNYQNIGIYIYNSNNNTVSGNTANNNEGSGICIYGSDNTTISGNTANNGGYGIYSYRSNSTTVSGNVVDNNVNYGIYTQESDYNLIYKNYFINNGIHALDEGNSNYWNSSIIGNYWDNYTGIDADKNGIGDTPHVFNGGTDYLPIYDVQAPLITINSPINGTYWNTRPTINIEATDTNLESIWYEVNGQRAFLSSGVGVLLNNEIWIGLPEGAFTIEIYANDTIGHLNDTYSLLLYKDTIAPIISINSPVNGTYWNSRKTINIEAIDTNLECIWYELNGHRQFLLSGVGVLLGNETWLGLPEGAFTIEIYANDTFGHLNDAYSLLLYKDTTPPIITINSPIQDYGYIDAPIINIAITELNLDTMWYVIVSEGTTKHIITSMIGSIDVSVWNSLADGIIAIKFYANDTAGNEAYSEVSIVKFTDTDPVPDPASGIPGFNVIIMLSVIFLVSVVIIRRKKKKLNLK